MDSIKQDGVEDWFDYFQGRYLLVRRRNSLFLQNILGEVVDYQPTAEEKEKAKNHMRIAPNCHEGVVAITDAPVTCCVA